MREQRATDRADRRCLARLASGEKDALEEIYDRHADRLFAQAAWVVGNRADAEDVVQAVLVKLAGMGAELLGIRRPLAYLLRMAHREAIDTLRRRKARSEEPEDGLLLEAGGPDAEERAQAALVERKIAGLEPAQREVVYLRLWLGLTFREIGRITGVSTFTAASRYRLALTRLRREMEA